jgi:hypothetical protein
MKKNLILPCSGLFLFLALQAHASTNHVADDLNEYDKYVANLQAAFNSQPTQPYDY